MTCTLKKFSLLIFAALLFFVAAVPSISAETQVDEAEYSAECLRTLGIFDSTKGLGKSVSRDEAIISLVRLFGKGNVFLDVTSSDAFDRDRAVGAAQYLRWLLRALGHDTEGNNAWTLSKQLCITDGEYNANSVLTRGEMALINLRALSTEQNNSPETLSQKLIREGVFTDAQYRKAIRNNLHAKICYMLPDYYFKGEYLPDRISEIRRVMSDSSSSGDDFIWLTDLHLWVKNKSTSTNGLNGVGLIRYIKEQTGINKVFSGGDFVSGVMMTADECLALIDAYTEYMTPIWNSTFNIIGNHEWNNPSAAESQMVNMLDADTLTDLLIKSRQGAIHSLDDVGDYWLDNKEQKIRYFFISCDYRAVIRNKTVSWLARRLKALPSGYTAVILSHSALQPWGADFMKSFQKVADLLDAALERKTYQLGKKVFDFKNFDADIACVICGHIHIDASRTTAKGIPVISTTCDRGPRSSSPEALVSARAYGTINEQAIDVVHIDTENKTVTLTRIGGSWNGVSALERPDRKFSYPSSRH